MTGEWVAAARLPEVYECSGGNPVQVRALAGVLSTAFANNAVSDWLFDGEQDTYHPEFFAAYVEYAMAVGRVEMNESGTAVAVWVRHGGVDPLGQLPAQRFKRATAAAVPNLDRLTELDVALYARQPKQLHWWLAFLGVHPDQWGKGYGSALLAHAASWQGDTPAYLEATSRRLAKFYQWHGFTLDTVVDIPGCPPIHTMTRFGPSPTGGTDG